ncbi:hypothetical protein BCR37DRAFT_388890 [Protomyces lactucae-debilis]|uniref:Uncharacterized protein n=1 Tax=Protomyces lactucae-debilis TaxID=2754530 RepID=A0A1Y2F2N8_PROLT|nr:uncharacterized protein BCR37DRAFT_388890 [Protomyces lactucae-debilis]ORY78158.1 hypothetical protein BCR37DRAFT_388890 [Protomyces lactucae-debilis]
MTSLDEMLIYARQNKLAVPARREAHYLLRETYLQSSLLQDPSLSQLDDVPLPKDPFVLSKETLQLVKQVYAAATQGQETLPVASLVDLKRYYLDLPLFKREPHEGKTFKHPTCLASAASSLPRSHEIHALQNIWQSLKPQLHETAKLVVDAWPLTAPEVEALEAIMRPVQPDSVATRRQAGKSQQSLVLELPLPTRRYPGNAYRLAVKRWALPETNQLDSLEEAELRELMQEPLSPQDLQAAQELRRREEVDFIRERIRLPDFHFELPEVPRVYLGKTLPQEIPMQDVACLYDASSTDLPYAMDLPSDPYTAFPPDHLNQAVEQLRLALPSLHDPQAITLDRSILPQTMLDIHRARHAKDRGFTVSALPAKHLDLQVTWMPFLGRLEAIRGEETMPGEELALDYLIVQEEVRNAPAVKDVPHVASSSTPVKPRPIESHVKAVQTSPSVSSVLSKASAMDVLEAMYAVDRAFEKQDQEGLVVQQDKNSQTELVEEPVLIVSSPKVKARCASVSSEDSLDRLVKRRKMDTTRLNYPKEVLQDPMLEMMLAQTSRLPVLATSPHRQTVTSATSAIAVDPQPVATTTTWSWIVTPRVLGIPNLLRTLKLRMPSIHFAERDCPADEADLITSYASAISLLPQSELRDLDALYQRLAWLLKRYRALSVLLLLPAYDRSAALQMAHVASWLKTNASDRQETSYG